ncbi:branched-chain amino acid ABC transporter permease [Treponema primitia]|uniref:branched-chain amino acid ABC transporter permease n=1 Tax=Treponema primitia TaxID=88058 RepID=UPI0002D56844|nr:branched-chain amino acid ABC transporter permease [Treponema primitia]
MSGPLFYYLSFTAIFLLASWAIYLPYRMGQLHFLAVANMVISAYFGALLSGAVVSGSQGEASAAIGLHWPFPAVLLAAALLSGLIGFLVSLAIGDAPCFAVVIVGFTFMYLFKTIAENTGALGRTMGMFNVPRIINSNQGNRIFLVLIIYLMVILIGFLIHRFEKSSLGRSASVIFLDRDLALSLGIDVKKTGMLLQTASSALGGLAGVLYLYVTRSISPLFITFRNLGLFMTILFVGGYTTPWGALLAAPILWGLPLILPEGLQPWKNVFYAFMLIFIIMIKPEGIITRPVLRRIFRKIKELHGEKGE